MCMSNLLKILPFVQLFSTMLLLSVCYCAITKTRCKICSKVTLRIPQRRPKLCSGVFIVNFKHISHLVLLFLLLTLNMDLSAGIKTLLSAAKRHKPLLLGKDYFLFNQLFHQKKVFFYMNQKNLQTIMVFMNFPGKLLSKSRCLTKIIRQFIIKIPLTIHSKGYLFKIFFKFWFI